MKKLILIVLFAFLTSACQIQLIQDRSIEQADTQSQLPAISISDRSEVPRVTLEEAKHHFDMDTAYFVDSRSRSAYETQHIAGAFYLPAVGLQEHLHELPKDKLVITYCT